MCLGVGLFKYCPSSSATECSLSVKTLWYDVCVGILGWPCLLQLTCHQLKHFVQTGLELIIQSVETWVVNVNVWVCAILRPLIFRSRCTKYCLTEKSEVNGPGIQCIFVTEK